MNRLVVLVARLPLELIGLALGLLVLWPFDPDYDLASCLARACGIALCGCAGAALRGCAEAVRDESGPPRG